MYLQRGLSRMNYGEQLSYEKFNALVDEVKRLGRLEGDNAIFVEQDAAGPQLRFVGNLSASNQGYFFTLAADTPKGQDFVTVKKVFWQNSSYVVDGSGATYQISDPLVTLTSGTGTGGGFGAAATATLQPIVLTGINLTAAGSGYSQSNPPSVSIVGGGGSGATAVATVSSTGAILSITLTSPGSGFTSAPQVQITGGNGAGAAAIVTFQGGGVANISVTQGGTGYNAAPQVFILGGGGSGATAVATVQGGQVTQVQVVSPGAGYGTPPAINFGSPPSGPQYGGFGNLRVRGQIPWSKKNFCGEAVWDGNRNSYIVLWIERPARFITCSVGPLPFLGFPGPTTTPVVNQGGGCNYTKAPTVVINAASGDFQGGGATATATVVGGIVTGITVTNQGNGKYQQVPTVTMYGGGGSGANATAVLSNGNVTAINLTPPNGPLYGPITYRVTYLSAAGESAASQPTAAVDPQGEQVCLLDIPVDPTGQAWGRNIYRTPAGGASTPASGTVTVDPTTGKVTAVTITNGGSGYVLPPPVTFTGTGTGAVGTAVVVGGVVTGVVIGNGGAGYGVGITGVLFGGAERLVGTLNDNLTTQMLDQLPDSVLGVYAPAADNSGSSNSASLYGKSSIVVPSSSVQTFWDGLDPRVCGLPITLLNTPDLRFTTEAGTVTAIWQEQLDNTESWQYQVIDGTAR